MSVELVNEFGIDINHRTVAAGSWVDGKYIEGAETNATIKASVQPLEGEELQMLFEGERTREAVKVFTTVKLKTADEETSISADRLTIGGQVYKVHETKVWTHGNDLPHYESIAVKLNDEGPQSA